MRDFLLRPICEAGSGGDGAPLAGGPVRFHKMQSLGVSRSPRFLPLGAVDPETLGAFSGARAPIAGVSMAQPRLMGILNATPDSFSDGRPGELAAAAAARGLVMAEEGADFIDIGGELTRPGADPVSPAEEQDRVLPVIEALVAAGLSAPISIDTRNASTARAALKAGAAIVNDVSGLTHDAEMVRLMAESGAPVCVMHAQGDPKTMQAAPCYRHVVIEVYAWLEERLAACVAAGIARKRIMVDPGIGFGKTMAHNLELMAALSCFHGLGAPILFGASRKRFIGTLTGVDTAAERVSGSIAAALAAAAQGAQILRVHDVMETRRALQVWSATSGFSGECE